MLSVGDTAPEFSLPGASVGEFDTHALSEYTDRGWTTILVFYPFDFHEACETRWCTLRDAEWLTILPDVAVLGIGRDSVYAHSAFAQKALLEFPLLSDFDGAVARAYGIPTEEVEGHPDTPRMAVVVVAPDGVIRYTWVAEMPRDEPDLDALREAVGVRTAE
ncbi:redoxin domain-containing protein [Natronomonas sp. EA1]|uniref:redoxin domain-containing protein n=1 Tax=Natronomonas sp. EA1 TaxID=3421655 RepID=UPI003EC0A714